MQENKPLTPDPQDDQQDDQQSRSSDPGLLGRILAAVGFVVTLLGILSILIPGLAGLLVGLITLGLTCALVGLVFGIVGLAQSGRRGTKKAASVTAVLLSVASVLLVPLSFFLFLYGISNAVDREGERSQQHDAEELAKHPTPLIGAKVRDGNLDFVVKSFSCSQVTSDHSGDAEPPPTRGRLCTADLTIDNVGQQPAMFTPDLVDGYALGRQYKVDIKASISANGDKGIFRDSIQPGRSITAMVQFDVPVQEDVEMVVLHESLRSGGAEVSVKTG
jgi:hypothetical protein